jgi:hypothetical protein
MQRKPTGDVPAEPEIYEAIGCTWIDSCASFALPLRSFVGIQASRCQTTITRTVLPNMFGCGIGGLSMKSLSPSKRM